jgi:hypothetical protein
LFVSVLLLLLVVPADDTAVNVAVVAMFLSLIGGELFLLGLLVDENNVRSF